MDQLSGISRRRVVEMGCLTIVTVAGCTGGQNASPVTVAEGFEEGLTAWTKDADVPEDPNDPGNPVAWTITQSTERAADGTASCRFYLDGSQDDGTIWIVRPVEIEAGQAYDVRMEVDAWSASESFNTLAHLVMYAGAARPTAEGSFPEPGTSSSDAGETERGGLREPLNKTDGWRTYAFTWRTPTLQTDTVYIASGISAVWETELSYYIDALRVEASRR